MASHAHLLREFLDTNHGICPRCEFDCFELDGDVCPECGEALCLRLGVQRLRFGCFVACLIPSAFSFVATVVLSMPISIATSMGEDVPKPVFAALLFGVCSAVFGVVLVRRATRFLGAPMRTQSFTAVVVWTIHVLTALIIVTLMV